MKVVLIARGLGETMARLSRAKDGIPVIACLVDRRRNPLSRAMRNAGFTVIDSLTADQVVALSASRKVDAIILDQHFFVETDGWSVAQSLKLVRPSVPVVLISRATHLNDRMPTGIDVVVAQQDPRQVIATLRRLLPGESAATESA